MNAVPSAPGVGIPTITVVDLPAEAVMLDVRESAEWAAGHAPQAQHLPMGQVQSRLGEVREADPLYVICRSGVRSGKVVAYLVQQGHNAVNVAGGMQSWAASGRPMVAETGGTEPAVI